MSWWNTEEFKINYFFLFKIFVIRKNVILKDYDITKKLKFLWSTIFSKILRFFCLVSSETIAKFYLESQLWILDNELLLDPVISNDINIFKYIKIPKKYDFCIKNYLKLSARRVGNA